MHFQEIIQELPGIGHGGANRFGLRADAQESKLGDRAGSQVFAFNPRISLCVVDVIRPDGGNQGVNIQEVSHGKSSRAARTCSLVIFRPVEPTACVPLRKVILTFRAGFGFGFSRRISTMRPLPSGCTKTTSPWPIRALLRALAGT